MKTLNLTLKKQWFEMTDRGAKPEEYREIKPYWIKRLCWHEYHNLVPNDIISIGDRCVKKIFFDVVRARNGYAKNCPEWVRKCMTITIDEGLQKWGAEPGKKYFVIKLGEKLSPPPRK